MDMHIKQRLAERMKIGVERYGHGVLLGMAEEELLDAIMYINADYQRK